MYRQNMYIKYIIKETQYLDPHLQKIEGCVDNVGNSILEHHCHVLHCPPLQDRQVDLGKKIMRIKVVCTTGDRVF